MPDSQEKCQQTFNGAGNQPRLSYISFERILYNEAHWKNMQRDWQQCLFCSWHYIYPENRGGKKKAVDWEKRWWSSNNTIKPHRPRAEGQKTLVPSAWTWGYAPVTSSSFTTSDGAHTTQALEGKSQGLFLGRWEAEGEDEKMV